MSKKHTHIPQLRFPEFKEEGEWEEKKLGDVFSIFQGYAFSSKDSVPKGIVWLKIADVGFQEMKNDTITYLPSNFEKEYERFLVKRGDYVIALTRPILSRKLKIAPIDEVYNNSLLNQRVGKLITHYVKEYVYYLLQTSELINSISRNIAGNDPPNLSFQQISDIIVYIPEKPEQQKIASCLSSLDALITVHTNKLEALKAHKKGLLQNLFPQQGQKVPNYRFPEFEKEGEWVEKDLIDTVDEKVRWSFTGGPFGSNLKASDYTKEGIRIIQLQNIGDGEFNDDYKIFTSVEKADELLSCNIYSGEIIISKMGDPVGRACIIPSRLSRCVMASDGIRLVVDEEKYSKYFIYSLLNSKKIRKAIERQSTGSTRKRIGLSVLKQVSLILPKNIKEQQKIASCLSALDALLTAQTEKITQLQLHKKGLMQGLFPKLDT